LDGQKLFDNWHTQVFATFGARREAFREAIELIIVSARTADEIAPAFEAVNRARAQAL